MMRGLKSLSFGWVAGVLIFGCISATARADGIKVLFLSYSAGGPAVLTDLLTGDSRFDLANSTVMSYGAPTVVQMQAYNVVMVSGNGSPGAEGNTLADYVDAGGSVLLTSLDGVVASTSGTNSWASSKINSHGYNPLTTPQNYSTNLTLGVHDASSPIFAGVNSLSVTYYSGDYAPGIDSNAKLVGSWQNGDPLVALNSTGHVGALTLFPGFAGTHPGDDYYEENIHGDYRRLFANTLATVEAGNPVPPTPPTGAPLPNTFYGGASLIGLIGLFQLRRRRRFGGAVLGCGSGRKVRIPKNFIPV